MEVKVQFLGSPEGFVVEKVTRGQIFSEHGFSAASYHSGNASHSSAKKG
jgi:hypothetical protein